MDEAKTLQEWRERRGYTVQELADRTGFPPARIRRWEEVGFDFYAETREGDPLFQEAMTKLNGALGPIPEGMSVVEAPSQPVPGDWVVSPSDIELLGELASRREEYGARVVVPTRWGPAIKEYKDVTLTDHKAIGDYAKAEGEWLQAEGQSFLDVAEFIEAQQESADEENLTLGEAVERHERSVAEVRKIVGEEEPETGGESREEPREVMLVPAFYPSFDNPDRWHRWDGSNEAWAWKAERDFFEDCKITAAARLYARVSDWSLVARLLASVGWEAGFDAEGDAEEFVEENRDRILTRLRDVE